MMTTAYILMFSSIIALICLLFRWRYLAEKNIQNERFFNEQLQRSEERSRKQFKSTPTPTYIWKKEGDDFVLTDYNDVVFNETNGQVQHMLGIAASNLMDLNPEVIQNMEECFTTHNTIKKESKYYINDDFKYYDICYAYLPPDSVILHMEDITNRMQMENELKESAEKYRTPFNAITEAILLVNTDGQILESNTTAVEKFGYTAEELQHTNIFQIIDKGSHNNDNDGINDVISDAEQLIIFDSFNTSMVDGFSEINCIKKNKETFPAELQTQLIKIQDNNILLLFIRDISERKAHLEEQERNANNLRKAYEELETFSFIISHDLKAPLRAINNLVEMLSADYTDCLDDEGKNLMAMLVNRATRMHELIESTIRYTKISKEDVVLEETDLRELIVSVVNFLLIPENIKVNIPDKMPTIQTPIIYLRQIFQNLLSNAVKYLDKPEGVITVGFEELPNDYKFWVQDNGSGIEEKHFEKIFQIFQTLQKKDEYNSTGIGLSIVKKIVDTYEGKIWIESEVGVGTTFFFTLPKRVNN